MQIVLKKCKRKTLGDEENMKGGMAPKPKPFKGKGFVLAAQQRLILAFN